MPRFVAVLFAVTLGLGGAIAAGCANSNSGFNPDADGGDPDSGEIDFDGAVGEGGPLPDGGKGKTVFYAHTAKTLFKVDADDPLLGVEKIGDFDCLGGGLDQIGASMTDIAVDKQGRLFGIGKKAVALDMRINGSTVECAGKVVALGGTSEFFGASFAPAGTLDPQNETLIVSDNAGDLYAIDTTSGAPTLVGNFGVVPTNDGNGHDYAVAHRGKRWQLSGDIVFLENKGVPVGFATVVDCTDADKDTCNKIDTLVEIDLSKLSAANPGNITKSIRGQIVKAASCPDSNASYGAMFGIAAAGSNIIGFSASSPPTKARIVSIENNKGTACLIADHTAAAGGPWYGAGVTTIAEVSAPPPK